MEWRTHVAVVTGGSRGIGRATARLLAQRGAAVCVNYAMHPDAAEAMVAEITTAGGRAIAMAVPMIARNCVAGIRLVWSLVPWIYG